MSICGIDSQVGRQSVADTGGEPISIRVGQASCAKLIWHGRRVKCKASANGPVRGRGIARPNTAEPGAMPLLRLLRHNGPARSQDLQVLNDTPVGPLSLGQQRKNRRNLVGSRKGYYIGRRKIGSRRGVLKLRNGL